MGSPHVSSDQRGLFGGALSVSVPSEFADVSKIREIPDNQEVFAHAETDRSLIVELLEMETDIPQEFPNPAAYHFSVLSKDSQAIEAAVNECGQLDPAEFPGLISGDPNVSISTAFGMHLVSKFRDDDSKANRVGVYMICVRLPRGTTDLLMVFNDPVEIHVQSSSSLLGSTVANPNDNVLANRAAVLRTALSTLEVKDWGLLL